LHAIGADDPKGEPLSGKWEDLLKTLIDYVNRSKNEFGHAPARVVITNGEWYTVFKDFEATLLSENPNPDNIIVFKDLGDIESEAEKFYCLLNYRSLSGHIPPQHPSSLPEFALEGEEVLCAQVVDVSYVCHGVRQPFISVRVAVLVRTTGRNWVMFYKNDREPFLPLNHQKEILQRHVGELEKRSKNLLADLAAHRRIKLLTAAEFEKLAERAEFRGGVLFREHGSPLIGSVDIRESDGVIYRLTVGDTFLYLLDSSEYAGCPFHFWGACHEQGDAVGTAAIVAPCSEPRAFFPSGSVYHCAHVAVHNARRNCCVLLSFEEYLCCQCCVFFRRCWPDGGPKLPCQIH
jgi:hypothetical protein